MDDHCSGSFDCLRFLIVGWWDNFLIRIIGIYWSRLSPLPIINQKVMTLILVLL